MYGEFSSLLIREDFKVRKGSVILVNLGSGDIELKVGKVYFDRGNLWVECFNKYKVGSTHSAHNLASYGRLKRY